MPSLVVNVTVISTWIERESIAHTCTVPSSSATLAMNGTDKLRTKNNYNNTELAIVIITTYYQYL